MKLSGQHRGTKAGFFSEAGRDDQQHMNAVGYALWRGIVAPWLAGPVKHWPIHPAPGSSGVA